MQQAPTLFLLLLVVVVALTASVPVPLLVWSGKNVLKQKNAHHDCTTQRAVIEQVVKKSLKNKVEALVFFVNDKMGSDEFMTMAGSFGAPSQYPKLKALTTMNAVSSAIYPGCPAQKRGVSVPELVSLWVQTSEFNSRIVMKHVYQQKQSNSQTSLGEYLAHNSALVNHKLNILFVHLSRAATLEQDNLIALTSAAIAQRTQNNYVALFTANTGGEEQETVRMTRSSLRLEQSSTGNSTEWSVDAPEPLYIDEHIVTGTLVGLLFLFMIYCAFYPVCNIQTAVHLTDLNVGMDEQQQQQQQQKKNK